VTTMDGLPMPWISLWYIWQNKKRSRTFKHGNSKIWVCQR